jgi:DMSO/TMAO reductase YedYZ heme-binding membrane subunit
MDTQQAQNYTALLAGMSGIFLILIFACFAFVIFLFWRIFSKAGMSGAMAFLLLVPGIGTLIVLCILAFGQWKVVPASSAIAVPPGYPPNYPPAG